MTPKHAISAIAAFVLILTACSGGDDEAATTTTTEATTTTTEATTTTVAATTTTKPTTTTTTIVPEPPRQPLTGEPLDDEADITDRPALAVKIDNHPVARRNHSGLAVADLVFEEKVEGSITRFAAVFHTQDSDPVGPIRSGRSQDVDILSSLNEPLFAWSGGNPGVTRLIRDSILTDLNPSAAGRGAYYRGSGSAPHNFYSDTETLYALTPEDHPGPPEQQFAYLMDDEEFDGDPATLVELSVGSIDVIWEWNADDARYERSQEGEKHVDVTYGQIGAENVIVMVVDYQPSAIDARSPEAQTLGDGPVYVFSDGKLISGRWSREMATMPITLTDDDGNPIELTPGQTWVELGEAIGTDDIANPDVALVWSDGSDESDESDESDG